ncbi:parallel beta-helix repeat protein [Methanococcus voltae]|uniref:Parallel beta-helix repeat protein n=1 Tax=Methanococcus voltae TaxID=2188 RepID=A0A8J7UQY0_METVO|nr:right-handed parallel beta-helix repeat-containing protein [Methanococcus voltae]MBP2201208.1 parallel beta-helix repeat protein [Methanococcus voltae]
MKSNYLSYALFSILLLTLLGCVCAAEYDIGANNFTEPGIVGLTIEEDGIYNLNESVMVDRKNAIYIKSSNVTINGNGYTLTYASGGIPKNGIRIFNTVIGTTNVTIHNLTLDGWDIGINDAGSNLTTISNVNIQNSESEGMKLTQLVNSRVEDCSIINSNNGSAILASSGTNCTFDNITIPSSPESCIRLVDCVDYTINGSKLSNSQIGIDLLDSPNSNILKNTIDACSLTGVHADYAPYSTFKDNEISSCEVGFDFYDTSYCDFVNNTIKSEGGFASHEAGVKYEISNDWNVSKNNISGYEYGIKVSESDDYNLTENYIWNNSIGVYAGENSDYVNIFNNTIYKNILGISLYSPLKAFPTNVLPNNGILNDDGTGNDGLDHPVITAANMSNNEILYVTGYVGVNNSSTIFANTIVDVYLVNYTTPQSGDTNASISNYGGSWIYLGSNTTDGNGIFNTYINIVGVNTSPLINNSYVTAITRKETSGKHISSEFGLNTPVREKVPICRNLSINVTEELYNSPIWINVTIEPKGYAIVDVTATLGNNTYQLATTDIGTSRIYNGTIYTPNSTGIKPIKITTYYSPVGDPANIMSIETCSCDLCGCAINVTGNPVKIPSVTSPQNFMVNNPDEKLVINVTTAHDWGNAKVNNVSISILGEEYWFNELNTNVWGANISVPHSKGNYTFTIKAMDNLTNFNTTEGWIYVNDTYYIYNSDIPYYITNPGNYFIMENIIQNNDEGILISADNVKIHGNGYSYDYYNASYNYSTDSYYGFAISSGDNISISNISMENWLYGIIGGYVENSEFKNIDISNSDTGMTFLEIQNSEISNNVMNDLDFTGILIYDSNSKNITILYNTIYNFGSTPYVYADSNPSKIYAIEYNTGELNTSKVNSNMNYPVFTNISYNETNNSLYIKGFIGRNAPNAGDFGNSKIELYLVNNTFAGDKSNAIHPGSWQLITVFNTTAAEFDKNIDVSLVNIDSNSYIVASAYLKDVGTSEYSIGYPVFYSDDGSITIGNIYTIPGQTTGNGTSIDAYVGIVGIGLPAEINVSILGTGIYNNTTTIDLVYINDTWDVYKVGLPASPLEEGLYTLNASTKTASNPSTWRISSDFGNYFVVDKSAPKITVSFDPMYAKANGTTNITVTVNDTSPIDKVNVTLNDNNSNIFHLVQKNSTTWYGLLDLGNTSGNQTVMVNISDILGHKNSTTYTNLYIDTESPKIGNIYVTPEEVALNQNTTIWVLIDDYVNIPENKTNITLKAEDNSTKTYNVTKLADNLFILNIQPNIENMSSGIYQIAVNTSDEYGNTNSTDYIKNLTVLNANITNNDTFNNYTQFNTGGTTIINLSGIYIEINTTENISSPVSVSELNNPPASGGAFTAGASPWEIQIPLLNSSVINNSYIKVYYSLADFPSNINENTLRLYRYNETSEQWVVFTTPNGGVNTAEDYVWAYTKDTSGKWIVGGSLLASTSSGSYRSSRNKDRFEGVADDVTSVELRSFISNAEVIAGNNIDMGYSTTLTSNGVLASSRASDNVTQQTILIGGPVSNPVTSRYRSYLPIPITNEEPGEGIGVIQTFKIGDYTVIVLAGSDRVGTRTAVEYFAQLDELPTDSIKVTFVAGQYKVVRVS